MKRSGLVVLLACGGLLSSACSPVAAPPEPAAAPAPPVSAAPAAPPVSPVPALQTAPVEPELAKQINSEIDAKGAKAVIAALDRDELRFGKVGDATATADPVWLTIALRLREGSDAGTGETLSYALARALPNAPERVLALVGHGYTVGNLCTSPFIEPAPGVAEAYEAKAVAALQSVTDPALKTTVEECIKGITLPPK
ncbi:hypothetical protein SAMN05216569_3314 [Pseudoxanthomonas sp. CF125]|nr:hypothetical protein SAMN05216569_3314 [Pseudoxanthomonas sp. CF125]